jgi:predicted metal-dependent hydrolase
MDERLDLGIREFNEGRYFEAHDILEDFWQGYREPDRVLLQALIHAAVGFYHLDNGNLKGCRSQLVKACTKMRAFLPEYWDLFLEPLHSSMKEYVDLIDEQGRTKAESLELIVRPRIQRGHRVAGGFLSIS